MTCLLEGGWVGLETYWILWLPILAGVAVLPLLTCFLSTNAKPSSEDPVFAVILSIATGNPKFTCNSDEGFRSAARIPHPAWVGRVLERIYKNSRIDNRFFCIPDFGAREEEGGAPWGNDAFYPEDCSFSVSSDRRFERFRRCALPLAAEVAKKALADAKVAPSAIGRLVLVTSTGDFESHLGKDLANAIGLRNGVGRELVSFQGCGGTINGLRLASQVRILEGSGRGGGHALLVSVELPSLHARGLGTVNEAILQGIFGDGCAAVVVGSGTEASAPPGSYAVLLNRSWLV
ncbi:unnamed protein product, partial [Discosporangium mesarthrocarpum]